MRGQETCTVCRTIRPICCSNESGSEPLLFWCAAHCDQHPKGIVTKNFGPPRPFGASIADRIKIKVKGRVSAREMVFIAGPLGKGDAVLGNVDRAIEAFLALGDAGLTPFLPHLFSFIHERGEPFSREYPYWTRIDNVVLRRCDGVLRLPGASGGADAEVELASSLALPVFDSVQACLRWAGKVP